MRYALFLMALASPLAAQSTYPVPVTVDMRAYNWVRLSQSTTGAQRVTADLSSSGSGKVLTFLNAPAGLRVGGFIYLSDGTGTAEAVPITATTCSLAGSSNCTATVTTSYAHTGSWTARSASSGLAEAVWASSPVPVTVQVASNKLEYRLYAGVSLRQNTNIQCERSAVDGVTFRAMSSSLDMFPEIVRTGASSYDDVVVEGCSFKGVSDSGSNTNRVFVLSSKQKVAIRNNNFTNVKYAVHCTSSDGVDVRSNSITGMGNFYFGGAPASGSGFFKDNEFYGLSDWSGAMTDAVIQMDGTAQITVEGNVAVSGLPLTRSWLTTTNVNEDAIIRNNRVIGGSYQYNLTGLSFSRVESNSCDNPKYTCVTANGMYDTQIRNNQFGLSALCLGSDASAAPCSTLDALIDLGPSSANYRTMIQGNVLAGGPTTGYQRGIAVRVASTNTDTNILGNVIWGTARLGLTKGIDIASGSNNLAVVGNTFPSSTILTPSAVSLGASTSFTVPNSITLISPYMVTGSKFMLIEGTGSWAALNRVTQTVTSATSTTVVVSLVDSVGAPVNTTGYTGTTPKLVLRQDEISNGNGNTAILPEAYAVVISGNQIYQRTSPNSAPYSVSLGDWYSTGSVYLQKNGATIDVGDPTTSGIAGIDGRTSGGSARDYDCRLQFAGGSTSVDGQGYVDVICKSIDVRGYVKMTTGATLSAITTEAPARGSHIWCTNCNIATPCTSGGSGATLFVRADGTFACPF